MRKLSAAFATASSPGLQTLESICGTPKSAEACAAVAPPPGVNDSTEPIGAKITGMRTGRPRNVDVAQHARPEGDRVEGQPVAAQRRLGLGGAHQVVPLPGGQAVLRGADDLVQ